jgi:hypothetical protein
VSEFRRRFRGTIRNAVVWGIAWAVLGFATQLVLRITGVIDAPVSVLDAVGIGLRVGVGGAIAGTAFSSFIVATYRNRRIRGISCLKFGVGGAVVTTISITGFIQGASLLGGGGVVPWRYLDSTLAMFAVFGFGAAAISMKLAQLATSRALGSEEVSLDDERSAQLASDAGAVPFQRRAHSEVNGRRD